MKQHNDKTAEAQQKCQEKISALMRDVRETYNQFSSSNLMVGNDKANKAEETYDQIG